MMISLEDTEGKYGQASKEVNNIKPSFFLNRISYLDPKN
jgi:hypothetical protein